MRKFSFYHLLFFCACAIGSNAFAVVGAPQKSILVVEFANSSVSDTKLRDAIQQAQQEFSGLDSVTLPDEKSLTQLLEGKAGGNVGMIVLIHPQDTELLNSLPGLYPDIAFTIIDTPRPTFAANVQTVQFKEEEGIFLLGAIAAIHSNAPMTVMALSDGERSQHLAENFQAGVAHVRRSIPVSLRMDIASSPPPHAQLAAMVSGIYQDGSSTIFSMDDEIIEQASRAAKAERKTVISGNPPAKGIDTARLLTYMVKRYDLALLDVLRIYAHKQWHSGTIALGVSGGYVDYSLNADNVEIFPKDSIDEIEAIKDYISQGMLSKAS